MNVDAQRDIAWRTYERLPAPSARDVVWQRFDLRALNQACVENRKESVRISATASDGVVVQPLVDQPEIGSVIPPDEPNKLGALVSARWQHGVFVRVPAGRCAAAPVEIAYEFDGDGATALPRTLVVVEQGGEATIFQRFRGNGSGFHASLTEIRLEENARLHYVGLQEFGCGVVDFTLKRAHVARGAEIDWVVGMFGGALTCYDVQCVMSGEGGQSFLYGMAVASGQQQIAQFTRQHHRVGHTTSDLLYRNVLRDRAISSYSGIIKVEKNANDTNAYQSNRNLLLDKTVRCDTRPILEIESNRLRCTHGATVGQLDLNQLFYMRTRGLDERTARQMLIEAFLEPVLARIGDGHIRDEFSALVRRKAVGEDD
ncbi:MAG: Fe-S cluster assembly protein SufD [Verrucomicrobiae bacterium]|nr:Fe-S cluster assembly protein SufD [Verrucomicrobiae bacterium]